MEHRSGLQHDLTNFSKCTYLGPVRVLKGDGQRKAEEAGPVPNSNIYSHRKWSFLTMLDYLHITAEHKAILL